MGSSKNLVAWVPHSYAVGKYPRLLSSFKALSDYTLWARPARGGQDQTEQITKHLNQFSSIN